MLAASRNVGMVLGIGVAGAVFTTVLQHGPWGGTPETIANGVRAALLVATGVALVGAGFAMQTAATRPTVLA